MSLSACFQVTHPDLKEKSEGQGHVQEERGGSRRTLYVKTLLLDKHFAYSDCDVNILPSLSVEVHSSLAFTKVPCIMISHVTCWFVVFIGSGHV